MVSTDRDRTDELLGM
uniref:Uncharacterized protein n=1 Tax=Anguilla anguilla TaxID=7936 RepID=A0A0E9TZU9_ANGAN